MVMMICLTNISQTSPPPLLTVATYISPALWSQDFEKSNVHTATASYLQAVFQLQPIDSYLPGTAKMLTLNQLCAPRHDGRDGKNNGQGRSGCTSFPDLQVFFNIIQKRGGVKPMYKDCFKFVGWGGQRLLCNDKASQKLH